MARRTDDPISRRAPSSREGGKGPTGQVLNVQWRPDPPAK